MTATNHALTGALIGLVVGNPLIALPAALLSHFVCDVIPHYGPDMDDATWLKSKQFKRFLSIDATLCVLLVAYLGVQRPAHWLLAAICAFLATSPDLLWLGKFLRLNKGNNQGSPNWFLRFARDIQWFQRPLGAVVEAAWFIAGIVLLQAWAG